jgi:hypothetical protein
MGRGLRIRNLAGQVIGFVRRGVFYKRIRRSEHFLRDPEAIACDTAALERAAAFGATKLQVLETESGATYTAPIERLLKEGITVDRGHGEQKALPLAKWTKRDPRQKELGL